MSTRPRDIGTAAETAVVRYLRTAGFLYAERRALRGALDAGDVTGIPGVAWEVKGGAAARRASDGQLVAWLEETERERVAAGADVGVLVVQRAGVGAPRAGRWWAVLSLPGLLRVVGAGTLPEPAGGPVRLLLEDVVVVLRAAGYGESQHHQSGAGAPVGGGRA